MQSRVCRGVGHQAARRPGLSGGGTMKVHAVLVIGSAFGMLAATAGPAFAVEPVAVVATADKVEIAPAASTAYLAWMRLSPRYHTSVWAEATGSNTPFRVNPKGTQAGTGGIDGSTLIYSLLSNGDSDLAMMDLSTRTAMDVPDGLNTNFREYDPSISGSQILFARSLRDVSRIHL